MDGTGCPFKSQAGWTPSSRASLGKEANQIGLNREADPIVGAMQEFDRR